MRMADVPTKQLVQQVLQDLPDDCTLDDVQYRLYLLDVVRRGREDAADGRVFSQDEVAARLRGRWGRESAT